MLLFELTRSIIPIVTSHLLFLLITFDRTFTIIFETAKEERNSIQLKRDKKINYTDYCQIENKCPNESKYNTKYTIY